MGPFPVVEATINKGMVGFFQAHALLAVHTVVQATNHGTGIF